MDSCTVYVSPSDVSEKRVMEAADAVGLYGGLVDVDVSQVENHPEDWGDFSILVRLFTDDASPELAAGYAERLSRHLGAPVLTKAGLNQHLIQFRTG